MLAYYSVKALEIDICDKKMLLVVCLSQERQAQLLANDTYILFSYLQKCIIKSANLLLPPSALTI